MCYKNNLISATKLLCLFSGVYFFSYAYSLDVAGQKGDVKEMEEIEVEGKIEKGDRAYTQQDCKRFITNPYGVKKSILAVAEETKSKGKKKRISTRGIKMPPDYVGRSIYRYQYTFPSGGKFSYYEGKDGFIGLGFHSDDGVIVLDVLDGAGPFASPMLWGPYDQIVGDKKRSTMEMMMGDGSQDGMGLLKSGYAIGYMAIMDDEDYSDLGTAYGNAVNDAVKGLASSNTAAN